MRPGFEQPAVGDDNDARRHAPAAERDAQVRTDTGGLARGEGDQRQISGAGSDGRPTRYLLQWLSLLDTAAASRPGC